jgi:hypothetical protein
MERSSAYRIWFDSLSPIALEEIRGDGRVEGAITDDWSRDRGTRRCLQPLTKPNKRGHITCDIRNIGET